MAIGNVILLTLLVSFVSALFGLCALPSIIDFVIIKFKLNACRASYTSKSVERRRRSKIEKSTAYSERLSEILKLIKQNSDEGECSLSVAWFYECETDKEIKRELEKRHFDISTWCDERNTMRISW